MTPIKYKLILLLMFVFVSGANAQVDQICNEYGVKPSLDSPFAHVPYVYGRIVLKGFDSSAKFPNVTVFLEEGQQPRSRLTIGKSGNYCFRLRSSNSNATLIIEVDGVQAARRTLASIGAAQQREDFEILAAQSEKNIPPGVVSAKFVHPPNPKTVELYKKTVEAESRKNLDKAVEYLKEIVSIDPADFIAWAKLGTLYVEKNSFSEADSAFRKSLELRVDYTPAWIHVGKLRVLQKQPEAAIEIFKHAISLEPDSARAYQLLGEAYLQARQGTLGVQALNESIKLDPNGMAESHLLLARLYDLAGAKHLAAREYKIFLTKEPNYPDKKKLEQYIKNNPDQ